MMPDSPGNRRHPYTTQSYQPIVSEIVGIFVGIELDNE